MASSLLLPATAAPSPRAARTRKHERRRDGCADNMPSRALRGQNCRISPQPPPPARQPRECNRRRPFSGAERSGFLEAASQKGIEEPIVQRNLSLRMLFRRSAVAGHLACDVIGQLLIPWLASPSLCQFSGDIGGAASIFALNRNHSNHDFARVLSNLGPSPPACGSFLRMMKASKNIMTAPKAST